MASVFMTSTQYSSHKSLKVVCFIGDPLPVDDRVSFFAGLPAANADIRVGDLILEVQGNDVRNATGEEVVEMVQ